MNTIRVTNNELYEAFINCKNLTNKERQNNVLKYITKKFRIQDDESVIFQIKKRLGKGFYNNYNAKLANIKRAKKSSSLFKTWYASWLSNEFKISYKKDIDDNERNDEFYEPGKYK